MNRLDEIFDVGCQRDYHERGMTVPAEARCLTCPAKATEGSWCTRHHPSKPEPEPTFIDEAYETSAEELQRAVDRMRRILATRSARDVEHLVAESQDRCVRCGRPLVDGVERATRVCHTCRVMGDSYGYA